MTARTPWPAFRALRLPLLVAGVLAAAAVGYVVAASTVVQRQLDAAGEPGCLDPNVCYPQGAALDAVLGMELTAAFVPALIGLVLGVPLLRRGAASLGVALSAGAVLTGAVALAYRLVGARYTVLANDTYEGLQLLHLNHPAFMVALSLVLVALGAVCGLRTGRVLPTLALTVAGWPLALITAYGGVGLVAGVWVAVFGEPPASEGGSFADDIGLFDGVGYAAAAILALCVAGLVLAARRLRSQEAASTVSA